MPRRFSRQVRLTSLVPLSVSNDEAWLVQAFDAGLIATSPETYGPEMLIVHGALWMSVLTDAGYSPRHCAGRLS